MFQMHFLRLNGGMLALIQTAMFTVLKPKEKNLLFKYIERNVYTFREILH